MNEYKKRGFIDQKDYYTVLSNRYRVPYEKVFKLAALVGKNNEFTGLLKILEQQSLNKKEG